MEPLAIAGYMLISSATIDGMIVGALGGAITRALRANIVLMGLLIAAGHLAGAELLATYNIKAAARFGSPLLVLTFLISWLAAYFLETRARWRRVWAALTAVVITLLAALLWGLLFRLGIWAPGAFAAAADVLLILIMLFARRRQPVTP